MSVALDGRHDGMGEATERILIDGCAWFVLRMFFTFNCVGNAGWMFANN